MGVTFPTRPAHDVDGAPHPGVPARADGCRCEHGPVVCEDGVSCFRCGRYLPLVIRRTWHQRAQQIAARGLNIAA